MSCRDHLVCKSCSVSEAEQWREWMSSSAWSALRDVTSCVVSLNEHVRACVLEHFEHVRQPFHIWSDRLQTGAANPFTAVLGLVNTSPKHGFLHTWWNKIQIFWYQINTVWVKKKSPLRGPNISRFSHKRLRIFNRFFTHLLHVPICARLQIFIQLSPILTKLCHIKRDYPCSKCPPSVETHALTRLHKSLIALLIVVCGK